MTKQEKQIWLMDIVSNKIRQFKDITEEEAQVFAIEVLDEALEKGVL